MGIGWAFRVGLVLVWALTTWGGRMAIADEPEEGRRDVHSFGNPREVRVTHVGLDLTVDFSRKVLRGLVNLDVDRAVGVPGDIPLIVDTKGLLIQGVSGWSLGKEVGPAVFRGANKEDPILGRSLTIELKPGVDRVQIRYETSPNAGALQWLDPARTAGKRHPFLFTQSQAIQARTWIPLQDSPGVRVTYDATIRVPEGLPSVMSAERLPEPGDPTVTRFRMEQAISSYLIALAVGDLSFQPLGPRTGVWAEPSVVAKAAYEFADTEKMIEATEKRFGPYRWGRYDLLVLPPSFPFGGMENPRLTFATPTVLAGDRSLVALVAHELAHSWSGNLVTNATWRDFWLNEGFTVYLERRIVEDVYGPERARIEAVLGIQDLRAELARLTSPDQVLHINLAGRDPDDGMTEVPYEKGALFLSELERTFGRARFDAFLLGYFDRHAFQSITTGDFVDDLKSKLFSIDPTAASKIDLDAWIEAPGLKAAYVEPTSPRLDLVDKAVSDWTSGKVTAGQVATKEWSTQEWLRFLRGLPLKLTAEKMAELDAAFVLTTRENSEISALWLLMSVRNDYHPADVRLEAFLTTIGRRKFLMPIYRELIKTTAGLARARAIYARARPFYHPIAVESVDPLLGVKESRGTSQ